MNNFFEFRKDIETNIQRAEELRLSTRHVIVDLAARYSNIQHDLLKRPIAFLRHLKGRPKAWFGNNGFRNDLVNDNNPSKHYFAYVYIGYFLPKLIGYVLVYLWEVLGFILKLRWASEDVELGKIGVRHGAEIRRRGLQTIIRNLNEIAGE